MIVGTGACRGQDTLSPRVFVIPPTPLAAPVTPDIVEAVQRSLVSVEPVAPASEAPPPSDEQRAAWLRRGPKTVLEAQLNRQTSSAPFRTEAGRAGVATLVDVAPGIGVWKVLEIAWETGPSESWHLENPAGLVQSVRLDASAPQGLLLVRAGVEHPCDLWGTTPTALAVARASGAAYAALCGGALALRNPQVGRSTRLEWTTDFLRDHVWGGEQLTTLVKETLYEDDGLLTAEIVPGVAARVSSLAGPHPASVAPEVSGRLLQPEALGLSVDGADGGLLEVGAWYPLHAVPDAWVSVFQARYVDPAILARNAGTTRPLDAVEGAALVYTVAFDLAAFDLGYELGTDHPRVAWSDQARGHETSDMAGPDGFGDLAPLVRTGTLDPAYISHLVGVFVGGYKRTHGAMRAGALSKVNDGSHYGFVAFGAELSRLQPGLATVVVWADQRVELRTWTEADAARLDQVRHARQNGVPLIERDAVTGVSSPGALVRDWSAGNWSGSAEGQLRSVRGGLCVQESAEGRFLLYSYFSSSTPSAMANVYDAYQCDYAMSLDMNALEHTYLAVHVHEDGGLAVEQLVAGMSVLDRTKGGDVYPRFVGYADNRDFFYLLRR